MDQEADKPKKEEERWRLVDTEGQVEAGGRRDTEKPGPKAKCTPRDEAGSHMLG